MNRKEFSHIRKKLDKTQKEMAQLLGTSIKAVHSYEQGWRSIPAHVERQIYFLINQKVSNTKRQKKCWTQKSCPKTRKSQCPAWEFKAGSLCWFINGTICDGVVHNTWKDKMNVCHSCQVFKTMIDGFDKL